MTEPLIDRILAPGGLRALLQPVYRISGDTWITSALISSPIPMTNPRVVSLFNSVGFDVDVLFVTLAIVVLTACVSPLKWSQLTPASTYGRTSPVLNLYLPTSGNSHAPDVVLPVTIVETSLPIEL